MGHEIRSEDGKVLGHFFTDEEYRELMRDFIRMDFDRKEAIDRANGVVRKWDGTNGKTTAQVLELFRKLDEQGGGR